MSPVHAMKPAHHHNLCCTNKGLCARVYSENPHFKPVLMSTHTLRVTRKQFKSTAGHCPGQLDAVKNEENQTIYSSPMRACVRRKCRTRSCQYCTSEPFLQIVRKTCGYFLQSESHIPPWTFRCSATSTSRICCSSPASSALNL